MGRALASSRSRAVLGAAVLGAVLGLAAADARAAAPCTSATAACVEWVEMSGAAMRAPVYRSHALTNRAESITAAFILVHGASRDADQYYRHALAAAFLAGALERTLVISPRFASSDGNTCRDTLGAQEASWTCQAGRDSWRTGGAAVNDRALTSFDVADQILRTLARKDLFPALKTIVVAGHSAGGQFVSRYAMANQVHERLGVPVTYLVSNPSSYAYLDAARPSPSALPTTVAAGAPGYTAPLPANPPPPFGPFADARNCTGYDSWPYGLRDRAGYSARISDDDLKRQLAARPVTYVLGGLDILPLFSFDTSCAAMAQGPTRLARGLAYARYVVDTQGASHRTLLVPSCGHNARCMFTAENVLPLAFPKE
jgi:hypothetical protein